MFHTSNWSLQRGLSDRTLINMYLDRIHNTVKFRRNTVIFARHFPTFHTALWRPTCNAWSRSQEKADGYNWRPSLETKRNDYLRVDHILSGIELAACAGTCCAPAPFRCASTCSESEILSDLSNNIVLKS